jgi:hypothetical protein
MDRPMDITGSRSAHPTVRARPRRRRRAAAVVLVLLLGATVACSVGGGSEDATSSEPAAGGGYDGGSARDGVGGGLGAPTEEEVPRSGAADEDGGPGTVGRPTVQTRAVIRTGEVSLVTKAMNQARVEIDRLLGQHGGYLASEDTTNDRAGRPERSVLVMRVPEPAFDDMMSDLGEIGRVLRADRRSEDVTTQVIDVDTRVATQEASLARLQRLLRRARDITDVIRLESEIATRQAELESLKAQQKYLADQTAMSTVTARLRSPAAPPPDPPEEDRGFLAGLSTGWAALVTVLVGAATVAGAMLPFAAALALLAVPLWLLVHTLGRRRGPEAPVPPPAAPDAG